MNIVQQTQEISRILGPEKGEPSGTYTLKKRLAVFGHDCLAHPLIWLSRDAGWAWAFHDFCGEVAMSGRTSPNTVRITGPGAGSLVLALHEQGLCEDWRFSPSLSQIKSPQQSMLGAGTCENRQRREAEAVAEARAADARVTSGNYFYAEDITAGDMVVIAGGVYEAKSVTVERGRVRIEFADGEECKCDSKHTFRIKK